MQACVIMTLQLLQNPENFFKPIISYMMKKLPFVRTNAENLLKMAV
jgi:hypothetical protein